MAEDKDNSTMIKLNTSNYSLWKTLMEDKLYCSDLYDPIEHKGVRPDSIKEAEWTKMDRKACGIIRKWVDMSVIHHVAQVKESYKLWTILEELFEQKSALKKASLIRRLVNLKYREGNSVSEHLNNYQQILNELVTVKLTIEDEVQALILLSSLPDSWETLVVTLSNSTRDGEMKLQLVKDSILSEETRRKEQGTTGTSSDQNALVTEQRGRSRQQFARRDDNRQSQDRFGRGRSRGRQQSRSPTRSKACYTCGKLGHFSRDCYHNKDSKNYRKKDSSQEDKEAKENTAAITSDGEIYLLCESNTIDVAHHDATWVIDTTASYHVTPSKEWFSTYEEGDYGHLKMGNRSEAKIAGIGDVWLKTNNGSKLLLKNVRHVPDIRLNLISTGMLDDDGYLNFFGNGTWKLTRGNMIVARGTKRFTLYEMQAKQCHGQVNAIEEDATELWHKRLGHLSEKGLQHLSKKEMIKDVTGKLPKTCAHCLAGKQHRISFHSIPHSRKNEPLLLVHTDVCSMTERSLGGANYFVSFIDDYSRKLWAYPIARKDQVLEKFKEFQAVVERETGKKLKVVRSDNGGEYSGQFEHYCKEQGIKMEKTTPRTPQHNGVAERMNRTICDRIVCMLSHAKLSKAFWGEALKTAVYLINRSPSVVLEGEVPEKMWTGKEVNYNHLRVFGCRAFVHVPKEERSKLDAKSKQCVFIGYGDEQYGYRLWDLKNKKLIRTRDVVFLENETAEDPKEQESDEFSDVDAPLASNSKVTIEGHGEPEEQQVPQHTDEQVEDAQSEEPVQSSQEPQVRRSTRPPQPSKRYSDREYVLLTDGGEPEDYYEAVESQHNKEWMEAMEDEMSSLQENGTYELVELPKGKRALNNKWVFKIKSEANSPNPRYKARLVVKGFGQKKGIDYEEIFSPVVKMSSIRAVLDLAASMDLEIEQLDVKTAFLHGELEEEIYMKQPQGFEVQGENLVCRLRKSLYGLKQAPRQWYRKFDAFMGEHRFAKTESDHCVYVKRYAEGDFLILLLYVDDMLIVGQDKKRIEALKSDLKKSFAMKDLGAAKQILGMTICRNRKERKLWLSQEKYIEKVLDRFNMNKANPVNTPLASHFRLTTEQCPQNDEDAEYMRDVPYASAVGSLMYAMVCTRPDIAHAVGVVSRFLSNPGKQHWAAVKWILRYLKGTTKLCLCYGEQEPIFNGFSDADLGGDMDSNKSTSGYLMLYGGGAISWRSKLQRCVSLSTTEAEYIALSEAGKEVLWIKTFFEDLGLEQQKYVLFCDNQSAIQLSKNPQFHTRTKHIHRRYHWVRGAIEDKVFEIQKVHTNDNSSDMMTKSLVKSKFQFCRSQAGLVQYPT